MPDRPWHALPTADVLAALESQPDGIDPVSVPHRRQQWGSNHIPPPPQEPWYTLLWDQLKSPLIFILAVAIVLALAWHEWRDAIVIGLVLIVNTLVGYRQEYQANTAVDQLLHQTPSWCHVIRRGELIEMGIDHVVVGDIVSVTSGDRLPADGRWVDVVGLRLDESSFTGESAPVAKQGEPVNEHDPLADQRSMGWRGTTVAGGRGTLVVTAVGMHTSFGHILRDLQSTPNDQTPLQKQITQFSRQLALATVVLGILVLALGTLRQLPFREVSLLTISLIVSVIPEGLPVVMTLAMTIGMKAMATQQALVRKLAAVETLGAVTVVATDKTGTVTFGQMMVQRIWVDHRVFLLSGSGYEPTGEITHQGQVVLGREQPGLSWLCRLAALNNDASFTHQDSGEVRGIGDPTELALLAAAGKTGWSKIELDRVHPRLAEVPFDARRKLMLTWHRFDQGQVKVVVKGALSEVLALCRQRWTSAGVVPLDEHNIQVLRDVNAAWTGDGLRDLAFAVADVPSNTTPNPAEWPDNFTFVGVVAMADELRPEAANSMKELAQAGIRTIMLTGDHQRTGRKIAEQLGLARMDDDTAWLDGRNVPRMSDGEILNRLAHVRVATRLSPEDKLRLARLLKQRGEIVAMTGDGVNDVPALVAADVGIAVGAQSTDAAKSAADVVLVDGNLSHLVTAVAEGRRTVRNIQRVLYYLLASNGSELLLVVIALLAGWPAPLLPTQIIWLNAVTDPLLGIALAAEPASPTVMREQPHRPGRPLLDRASWGRVVTSSLVLAIGGLAVFALAKSHGRPIEEVYAVTVTTIAVGEWFIGLTSRSFLRTFVDGFGRNRGLVFGLLGVVALQLAFLYLGPMQRLFSVTPLSGWDWILVVLGAAPVLVVDEVRKWILRRRYTVSRRHILPAV